MASSIEQIYRYAHESVVATQRGNPAIHLATSGGTSAHPYFFEGQLVRARLSALLLRAVSNVAGARYYTPPAMLQRILAAADPVVTSGGGLLRFEAFSACSSLYARSDFLEDAYSGDVAGTGTTNVNFNAPLRAALAQVRDGDAVKLAVGTKELALSHNTKRHVERKVALPVRWLKSFSETAVYQAGLTARLEMQGTELLRFLRSLPRTSSRHPSWVVPAGRGVRLSQHPVASGVRLSGHERLRLLEELAPLSKRLRVWSDDEGDVSAWQLEFESARFVLVLSGDVWRGFSGEGQLLSTLAVHPPSRALLAELRGALHWESRIAASEIAERFHARAQDAERALTVLGARGLLGFDLTEAAWFHREFPFDLAAVDSLQPRLIAARKLVASGGVKLPAANDGGGTILVAGSDVEHRVRLGDDRPSCTCTWFAKYQGKRGPCRHVLAAEIALEEFGVSR